MTDSFWIELGVLLRDCPTGILTESLASKVTSLLGRHWNDLPGGSETAMDAEKLDRIENLSWFPPTIQFDIERHGAQPFGSKFADVHRWTVDVQSREAKHWHLKKRQILPKAKSLDVNPIVQRVISAVGPGRFSNQPCDAIRWKQENEIHIHVSDLISDRDVPKATLEGRRKRFRVLLVAELEKFGWILLKGTALRFRRMSCTRFG